ncbi:tape measure protein [Mycolicibacterium boenickei]|nr:tape measure protein [Mycolicibacterium boenickei]
MSAAIDRSTSNIGQRVTGQFTTHGQTAGRNFGTGFTGQVGQTVGNTSGFTSALAGYQGSATQVGSLAGKALGTAFTVAAGGLIGAASLTLFKGFERYKSIDAAKNRLENLNRTLESTGRAGIDVKAVMDTVTQAVTDTPFAMDKAFSVATRALASNTGDLKRFMTVVTDAAGFAGAGVDEIGGAFLKIANTGKVSMEEIGNELRNIPILPWLQEQLGVTGGELQKLISDGKVGLNDLMKAVESHASGFAKASGDTIEGAMSNMQTSVARLGANFLGAIFGKPTEDGNELVEVLKTLRVRVDDVGGWVNAHQGDIRKFFEDGVAAGKTILELLNELKNALGGTENTIKIVAAAFIAWKTIGVFKTVSDLVGMFGKAGGALDVLPGKADKAAKGIGAALAGIQIPAWLATLMKWGGPAMVGLQSDQKDATDLGLPEVKFDKDGRAYFDTPQNKFNVPGYGGGSGLFDYDDWQAQVRPNPARRDGLAPFSLNGPAGYAPAGNPILDAPGSGAGSGSGPKLPDAPVVPYDTSLPPGILGMPADASVFGAESSFLDARQKLAEKSARVAQLERDANATEDDRLNARNEAAMAQRDFDAAEMRMGEARQNQYEQLTKQSDKYAKKLEGLTKDLGDVGASLDADFGISKGLVGIAENITKFVANLAAAPLLGQLSAIEKANPTQGGHGMMGVLAAQGAFGPMYQNNQYADLVSGLSGGSVAGAMSYPAAASGMPFGPSGMAKPGESARDFAHRVMMPFWKQQGLTVGDHAADYAGEHQNGALDIMVKDLAQGQQVLQQVLSDPNVYGAIFDNKTYGYGHGLTPQDYKSGHTGNPTQDHQDHVHAWYKPGGSNNITPTRVGPASIGPPASPATVGAPSYGPASNTPALPPLTGVPSMPGGPMASGMPQGLPMGAPLNTTQIGANVAPASGSGSGGIAMDGGGAMGIAMQAGGMALDAMAPGAGQAAQTGMKLINRAIQYGGQVAGIGAQGLMETFLPTGGSELASNNWLTRIVGGLAGAAPALPNLAGKGAEPLQPNQVDPNTTQHGQGGQPGPTFGDINVTTTRDDGAAQGRDIGYHLQNMYAAPGM